MNDPMSEDLIRRSDALKALGEEPEVWVDSDYEIASRNQWNTDRLAIETVPSAQPEHVTCYLDGPCEYQTKDITLWNIYVEAARYEAAKMDERVVNAMVNGVARDCGIELDKDKLTAMAEFYKRLCMCKDCVNCQQTAVMWCMYHDTSVTNKGYCSWGRRKDEQDR